MRHMEFAPAPPPDMIGPAFQPDVLPPVDLAVAAADRVVVSQMEAQFSSADIAPTPVELERERLLDLPAFGYSEERKANLVDALQLSGLPTEGLNGLWRLANTEARANVLGGMGMEGEALGQLALYERLDYFHPLRTWNVINHELSHLNTPLAERNNYAYGGEEERLEAAGVVTELAGRFLDTRTFIDPYHASLAERLDLPEGHTEKITRDIWNEETSAILMEHRLSGNEAHLRQLQSSLDVHAEKKGHVPVDVITREGETELSGVDKGIGQLIGVADAESLGAHIQSAKEQFLAAQPSQPERKLRLVELLYISSETPRHLGFLTVGRLRPEELDPDSDEAEIPQLAA